MTVTSVDDSGKVHCEWFDGDKLHSFAFSPESLRRYKAPAASIETS